MGVGCPTSVFGRSLERCGWRSQRGLPCAARHPVSFTGRAPAGLGIHDPVPTPTPRGGGGLLLASLLCSRARPCLVLVWPPPSPPTAVGSLGACASRGWWSQRAGHPSLTRSPRVPLPHQATPLGFFHRLICSCCLVGAAHTRVGPKQRVL